MNAEVLVRTMPDTRYGQDIEARTHKWVADEPTALGGEDRGPAPYEFLLASLGT